MALEVSQGAPDLSVVVIGRNEGPRLERCLRSVLSMERGHSVELIYVDSASTDGSAALAERMGARTVELLPEGLSAARARNAGWKRSTAPFILFLDGDTVLHPRFVIDSLPAFRQETVAIVWGHRREIDPGASLYNRILDLDWIYPPGETEFCGGDALVRNSALEKVNGFDETLIAGEEPEMCRRLRACGYKIAHVDRPMTGHDLAMTTWKQYWRRATRAGYAYAEVSKRFRDSQLPFWDDEVCANRIRAVFLALLPLASFGTAIAFSSPWPIFAAVAVLAILVWRTAWKAKWKSNNIVTRLLYGLHSHVQQVPIFVGQLQYARDTNFGRRHGLIEHKNPS